MPPVVVLLEYARIVDLTVETLIDDDLDLPPHLAVNETTKGRRKTGK